MVLESMSPGYCGCLKSGSSFDSLPSTLTWGPSFLDFKVLIIVSRLLSVVGLGRLLEGAGGVKIWYVGLMGRV